MRTLALAAITTIGLVACHEPGPTEAERSGPGAPEFAAGGSGITITDLGTLQGDVNSYAYDISGTGIVVGYSDPGSNLQARAVRWTSTNGKWVIEDLASQLVGSTQSFAYAVNDAGDVVGEMTLSSGSRHGFLLTAAGTATDLGGLPGSDISEARSVNNSREVTGYSGRPFYWTAAVGMSELPTLGGDMGTAFDINDNSVIVGVSTDPAGMGWPVRWTRRTDGSGTWDITKLAVPTGSVSAAIEAVNANGDAAAGSSRDQAGREWAVSWPPAAGVIVLSTLGGNSQAYGINTAGQIVGYSMNKALTAQYPVLWSPASGIQKLGTLARGGGGMAMAINDSKQIAGISAVSSAGWLQNWHAALWTLP